MKKFGFVAVLALLAGNAWADMPYETVVPASDEGIASAKYAEEIAKAVEWQAWTWSRDAADRSNLTSTVNGTGPVVTAVEQSYGKVTVTLGQVKVPVGDANGAGGTAAIWIE